MTSIASQMLRRLPPIPTIADILRIYQLNALRELSQNFLLDMNLSRKIVTTADPSKGLKDSYVFEVGPGPGSVTRAILEHDIKQLTVIEKDRRFLPSLEMLRHVSDNKINIHIGDVRTFDQYDVIIPETELREWKDDCPNIHIIANLPFNVSTFLIIQWLKQMSYRTGIFKYGRVKLTLTFQHEVAERIVAKEFNLQRSRLSVMCQHLADVKYAFTMKGRMFKPQPKVDVGVVTFEPLDIPLIDHKFELVEKVCRSVFSVRRGACRKSIGTLYPPDVRVAMTNELLNMANVNGRYKSVELSNEDFNALCDGYKHQCDVTDGLFQYDHTQPSRSKHAINQIVHSRNVIN